MAVAEDTMSGQSTNGLGAIGDATQCQQSGWYGYSQQSGTRIDLDCWRKERLGESGTRSQAAFGANESVPMAGSGTTGRIGESVLVGDLRMRGRNIFSKQKQRSVHLHPTLA